MKLVCSKCGGTNIQKLAWVDANTQKYVSEGVTDVESQWCEDCKENTSFKAIYEHPPIKRFNIRYNVGRVKYLISFHDGIKKHKDGSDFFDIATFSNKKELATFEKELLNKGYKKTF